MSRMKQWAEDQPDTSADDAACVMQEWQAEYEQWLDQVKEQDDERN